MMDEFDLVGAARDEMAPSDDITARHRAALERATAARPRMARRAAKVAAVLLLLVGLAAGVLVSSGDDTRLEAADGTPTSVTPAATTPVPTCSGDLPGKVERPVGATGPHAGATDGGEPAAAGQLVQHWVLGTETIEVRWPGDDRADLPGTMVDRTQSTEDETTGAGTVLSVAPSQERDGRWIGTILAVTDAGAAPCDRVSIEVAGDSETSVNELMLSIEQGFFADELPPLVVAQVTIAEVPESDVCQSPPGTVIANVGGEVDGPVGATPEEALHAFLDAHMTLPTGGYTEGALPDGSIAYYWESMPGFIPTVIHVTPLGDQWRVIAWDAAGC